MNRIEVGLGWWKSREERDEPRVADRKKSDIMEERLAWEMATLTPDHPLAHFPLDFLFVPNRVNSSSSHWQRIIHCIIF